MTCPEERENMDNSDRLMILCPRCKVMNLPSVYVYVDKDGNEVGICTSCANHLRFAKGLVPDHFLRLVEVENG